MKKKGTKNITYTQRLQIEACLRAGLPKRIIADSVGLCLSAVYKEIKRGEYVIFFVPFFFISVTVLSFYCTIFTLNFLRFECKEYYATP